MRAIVLRSGHHMPIVGLGTWRASPEAIQQALNHALTAGYRHIDTAFVYKNEEAIGDALKPWLDSGKVKRNELFITTKLPVFGNRPEDVERFLRLSLDRLKLSYVDLYLMHFPFAFFCDQYALDVRKDADDTIAIDFDSDFIATWKVMEQQVTKGWTKSIGVSNFNAEQITALCQAAEIKPDVLQIEMHAYLQQPDLVRKCKEMNIAVTAYSPLGSPGANQHFQSKYNYTVKNFPDLLNDPLIVSLAAKYERTTGQILLRHLVQKDIIVIPKSSNEQRIKDNLNVLNFELSAEDMASIDKLDRGAQGRILNFLFFKGVEAHRHYPFLTELPK